MERLKTILLKHNLSLKKAFGQNFLTDTAIIITAIILSVLVGITCAFLFSKKIMQPIEKLNLDHPDLSASYG